MCISISSKISPPKNRHVDYFPFLLIGFSVLYRLTFSYPYFLKHSCLHLSRLSTHCLWTNVDGNFSSTENGLFPAFSGSGRVQKMLPIKRLGAFSCFLRRKSYFRDSSTATATETVIPTMGLLPAPRKPIIST